MRRCAVSLLVLVALCLGSHAARAEAPFSFDTTYGRLPKNVKPIAYSVAIVPNPGTMRIEGRERVVLEVRTRTATLQFNSLNERLRDVRFDGTPVATTRSSDGDQLTTVTLSHTAAVGKHTLSFAYTGRIETTDHGLFVQPYTTPDGKHGVVLQTMFEATGARMMFPCWDEPAFRATFQLSATVAADEATISNMLPVSRRQHGAMATTTFAVTPPMPTYLLEFTAGHMTHIDAMSDATLLRVWAVQGQETGGAVALANARQILSDYNDYFGVRFPLPKLDSIAVPGGFNGGMENWGAIVYNDQSLLVTPASTIGDRQEIYSIQAHEMAHQWNGDLVTMGWWDDLWLNESFASWRSAKETAERNPRWNWWEVQDGDKEGAMDADAHITSHPIHVHITNELEAETSFDEEITYSKGQAFLRMLEAYLTPEVFRDGVRRYIKARAYSNATSADLWSGLSAASHRDVGQIASAWINQAGFPLISVRASCDAAGNRTIALHQERFLLDGVDPSHAQWAVPLSIRSGVSGAAVPVLLTKQGQTVAAGRCGEPLAANAGLVGYYRVAYDDATLQSNIASFATLGNADRIALLDDQWALARAGKAPLGTFLALAGSMGNDRDARAWNRIVNSLTAIEIFERGTSGYGAYLAYARSVIKPLGTDLGWDARPHETPDVGDLRRNVLLHLGIWGDSEVIAEARKRFAAYLSDHAAIPVDDQELVFQIVAVNADAATFDQLHALATSTKNETELRRIDTALMLVRDDALAQRALAIALSNEIPPQAAELRIELVGALGFEHPTLAWNAYRDVSVN